MDFGTAMKLMRAGVAVTRAGWSRDHNTCQTVRLNKRGELEEYDWHDGSYYAGKPAARRCTSVRDIDILATDWEAAPDEAQPLSEKLVTDCCQQCKAPMGRLPRWRWLGPYGELCSEACFNAAVAR